jgi:aspartate aminotransferase
LASRLGRIKESASNAAGRLATEFKAQGGDIISLPIGEPEFPTPDNVKREVVPEGRGESRDVSRCHLLT